MELRFLMCGGMERGHETFGASIINTEWIPQL